MDKSTIIEKIFRRAVVRTINSHRMFQAGESVLIGVSGGPDSLALLSILHSLAPVLSIKIGIAHLNHSLRKNESDKDAAFVNSVSEKLKVPCFIKTEDVHAYRRSHKLSLEEAARIVRYRFYNDLAENKGFDKIALGHNSNDNAELVLMNLFRGSGPLGLSGIPPVRDGKFVRPLIEVSRGKIIEYLSARGLEYVTDKSNKDERYLRNRIRNTLIPDLEKSYNPKISQTLNRLSSILRAEDEWIEKTLHPAMNQITLNQRENRISLSATKLRETHIAVKRRFIRGALKAVKGDLRRISYSHIESIIRLIKSSPTGFHLDLPDSIGVSLNEDAVTFLKMVQPAKRGSAFPGPGTPVFEYSLSDTGLSLEKTDCILIKETGMAIQFTKAGIESIPDVRSAGQTMAFFDMDSLIFPLIIRNFRPGDRFNPLGLKGSQKIKKFFINKKLSRTERAKCPILLSNGAIIWVAGHRIDESVKVTPSTINILKAELFLA